MRHFFIAAFLVFADIAREHNEFLEIDSFVYLGTKFCILIIGNGIRNIFVYSVFLVPIAPFDRAFVMRAERDIIRSIH